MRYIKDNVITSSPNIPYVSNPSHEIILANGWEVYEPIADQEPSHRIRITAPTSLADEKPELLLYLYKCERVRGMPVEREGNNIVIYCNEILEGDVGVIKSEPRVSVEALSEAGAKHLRGIGFDFEK